MSANSITGKTGAAVHASAALPAWLGAAAIAGLGVVGGAACLL
jgi:hypothetical protein